MKAAELREALRLSSPSVAQYHLLKLQQFGLVREDPMGYVVERVVFENVLRFRRTLIPVHMGYLVFFASAIVVLLIGLRPPFDNSGMVFALLVMVIAALISAYESYKAFKRI